MKPCVLVLLSLALAGCTAHSSQTPAPLAAPVPGMAQLSVTRSGDLLYVGAPATVEVNGGRFADLAVGESRSGAIRPGPTVVTVSAWSAPGRYSIRFEAEPNKQYRLHVAPRGEPMVAGMMAGIVGQAIEGGGPFQIVAQAEP